MIGLVVGTAQRLPLRDKSVHCAVTSPPYFGLRDYGIDPEVWGGDPACAHQWGDEMPGFHPGQVEQTKWKSATAAGAGGRAAAGQLCLLCGAWLGCLGLEPTPELYVEHMVAVFREVRRVLRDDGTLWLNLGDSYAGSWGAQSRTGQMADRSIVSARQIAAHPRKGSRPCAIPEGAPYKPKDLIGVPWMVAFALRADGWYLRMDNVWGKPNPMPESVTDRPTRAHEYVFLLTKKPDYYYDRFAILEPLKESSVERLGQPTLDQQAGSTRANGGAKTNGAMKAVRFGGTKGQGDYGSAARPAGGAEWHADPLAGANKRSVWWVSTKPYKGAHFATMPPDLVEPCVLAGTSAHGCCPACGAPWERVVEARLARVTRKHYAAAEAGAVGAHRGTVERPGGYVDAGATTIGWRPTCKCGATNAVPCVVIDPFSGSGTVAAVAKHHGRSAVGVDRNPTYVADLATERAGVGAPKAKEYSGWSQQPLIA